LTSGSFVTVTTDPQGDNNKPGLSVAFSPNQYTLQLPKGTDPVRLTLRPIIRAVPGAINGHWEIASGAPISGVKRLGPADFSAISAAAATFEFSERGQYRFYVEVKLAPLQPGAEPVTAKAVVTVYVLPRPTTEPPRVWLIAPLTGYTSPAGRDVELIARAQDDGELRGVEFFDGSKSIAIVTKPDPDTGEYRGVWKNPVTPGTHKIRVRAVNVKGAVSNTLEAIVTITAPAPSTQ